MLNILTFFVHFSAFTNLYLPFLGFFHFNVLSNIYVAITVFKTLAHFN